LGHPFITIPVPGEKDRIAGILKIFLRKLKETFINGQNQMVLQPLFGKFPTIQLFRKKMKNRSKPAMNIFLSLQVD